MKDCAHEKLIIGTGPVDLHLAKTVLQHQISYEHIKAADDVDGNEHHEVYTTGHILSYPKPAENSDFPMPIEYPDFARVLILIGQMKLSLHNAIT
jgi:hypothetical protein